MLTRILIRIFGGIWNVRSKYESTRVKVLKRIFSFLYYEFLKQKGSWISLAATFKGEPCFPHGIMGIFISGAAVVGKNCVIFHQVSIGSNTLCDSGGSGAPWIGEGCYIGAGAKIIGNIRIGNHTRIGANTFVYQDVAENSVVTCAHPRIIRMRKPLNNKFYHLVGGDWEYFDDGDWMKVNAAKELFLLKRRFGEVRDGQN